MTEPRHYTPTSPRAIPIHCVPPAMTTSHCSRRVANIPSPHAYTVSVTFMLLL